MKSNGLSMAIAMVLAGSAWVAPAAWAQDQKPAASSDAQSARNLGTVVVTARKREETLPHTLCPNSRRWWKRTLTHQGRSYGWLWVLRELEMAGSI